MVFEGHMPLALRIPHPESVNDDGILGQQSSTSRKSLSPFALHQMLSLSITFLAVCATAGWFLWKVLRNFILKSPLDNIPGPPSDSWWSGICLPIMYASLRLTKQNKVTSVECFTVTMGGLSTKKLTRNMEPSSSST